MTILTFNLKNMKKVKLSLSNVIGKLTRNEMRYVLAGSGGIACGQPCILYYNGSNHSGMCNIFALPGGGPAGCYCNSGGQYARTCNGV